MKARSFQPRCCFVSQLCLLCTVFPITFTAYCGSAVPYTVSIYHIESVHASSRVMQCTLTSTQRCAGHCWLAATTPQHHNGSSLPDRWFPKEFRGIQSFVMFWIACCPSYFTKYFWACSLQNYTSLSGDACLASPERMSVQWDQGPAAFVLCTACYNDCDVFVRVTQRAVTVTNGFASFWICLLLFAARY